ncbi:MAG: hypothetical protein K0S61_4531 [Anaerocolumna sp.]|jgi:hypothetical protein|nr:hypothetical protein [Anaerocolumna sp.]
MAPLNPYKFIELETVPIFKSFDTIMKGASDMIRGYARVSTKG